MNAEKINKTSMKKNTHDRYCWICHGTNGKRMRFECEDCFRTFHNTCLNSIPVLENEENSQYCTVCLLTKRSKDSGIDDQKQLKMLKYIMTDVMFNPEFQLLNTSISFHTSNKEIFRPINLSQIKENVNNQKYDCFHAFLGDIECILHNSFIHSGSSTFTKAATNLFKFCDSEIEAITSCTVCYQNKCWKPNQWRKISCDRPHLLLWVKLTSRSLKYVPVDEGYWPAKFITSTSNRKDIKVMFFGYDKIANISAVNCQLYTVETSALTNPARLKDGFDSAVQELNQYANNVKIKFNCRFVDTMPCTPFDLDRVDEFTKAMFPGVDEVSHTAKNMEIAQCKKIDSTQSKKCAKTTGSTDRDDEIPTKRPKIDENASIVVEVTQCKESDSQADINDSNNKIPSNMPKIDENARIDVEITRCQNIDRKFDLIGSNDEIPSKIPKIDKDAALEVDYFEQIANFNSVLRSKFQRQSTELDNLKMKYASSEQLNKQLYERLQAMQSDHDQLEFNRIIETNKTRNDHAREIELLQNKYDIEHKKMEQMQSRNLFLHSEFTRKNDELTKAVELEKKAKNCLNSFKKKYKQELIEMQSKLKDLSAQIQVTKSENEKGNEKIAALIKSHEKSIEQLRENLKIGHQKEMNDFQLKLDKERRSELTELREQHKKEMNEKERAKEQYMTAVKNQLPAFIANQLSNFITNLKQ